MFRFLCIALLFGRSASVLGGDSATIDELIAAAEATSRRMQVQALAWTVTHQTPEGAEIVVDVVSRPIQFRWSLEVRRADSRQKVVEVIETDGFWFVDQGGERKKYREFEAPMVFSLAYFYRGRSNVVLVTRRFFEALRSVETSDEETVVVRMNPAEQQKTQLSAMLKQIRDTLQKYPQLKEDERIVKQMRTLEDLLKGGHRFRIDRKTGILRDVGVSPNRAALDRIRWLEDANREFDVLSRKWKDLSAPPTQDSLKRLVMIGHQPLWRVGQKGGDSEVLLLDTKTLDRRRLPYRGSGVYAGCFSHDRRKAYISGMIQAKGAALPFEIDLTNGRNRPLGIDELNSGFVMAGALSPDGTKLAVSHLMQQGLQQVQVCLIDLESDAVTRIGKPADIAFLNWHPDGESLILATRRSVGFDALPESTICRLDSDGTLTPLRRGRRPAVLPQRRRILFDSSDGQDRRWMTCDLEGKNLELFGDGMDGFGFPAVSPEGHLMMMMKFGGERGPRPHMVEIGSGKSIEIPLPGGLWSRPAWR